MRFEDILNELKVSKAPEGHDHHRAGWLQFDCPFCGLHQHYRMGYNLQYKYVNCWACGSHGLAETLVLLGDISYREANAYLADLEITKQPIREEKRGTLKLPAPLIDLTKAHKSYLRERGFDVKKLVRFWDLKATNGLAGRKSWRIVIPIKYHNEIVSWTSRKLNNEGLRWISAAEDEEILNHKKLLYGIDYVRHGAIVCEGPTDVWSIGPGAVATCGIGFSQEQVEALSRLPVRVICFDSAPEAQKRAKQLVDALHIFPGRTLNVLLDADDPGSASRREISTLRRLLH